MNINTGEKSEFRNAYKLTLMNNNLNKFIPVYNPINMEGYDYNPKEETCYFLMFKKNDPVKNDMMMRLIYYYDTHKNADENFELSKETFDSIDIPENWCPITDPIMKERNCSNVQLLPKRAIKLLNDNGQMIGIILLMIIIYILYRRY